MREQFIESLKRLYIDKKITEEKIRSLCANKTITAEEMKHILQK